MCRTCGESPSPSGGEQPLPPYGSCNLGSLNLANFVLDPYTETARVDWDRLKQAAETACDFLEAVIDVNKYPVPGLEQKAKRDRRIGLGVMGWAEMLVQLGLAYDSPEAVRLGNEVMREIKLIAMRHSMEKAALYGPYPEWEGSLWHAAGIKLRNATLTTVAPTGTISMFAAQSQHPAHQITGPEGIGTLGMPCTGGIEPKFALAFTRNQAGMLMVEVDQQFEYIARREGWYTPELMDQIAANHGSCAGIDAVPEKWQRIFKTAHDIAPEWHVRMQSGFQGSDEDTVISQPVDAAVSKTCNFPQTASVGDVAQIYMLAWQLGLKGITVYRDGARANQVLSTGTQAKAQTPAATDGKAPKVAVLAAAEQPTEHTEDFCPEGGAITHSGGCVSCTCGWSLCHIS